MGRQVATQRESASVPSEVGQRLRRARHERGLSLAQLGGADLTRGFLSAVETGRSSISLRALALVADRLELPVSYFLEGTAGARDALQELLLDDAETALRSQQPSEALRLANEFAGPREYRSRKLWLEGWAILDLGRAREAVPLLQEALALAETGSDLRHTILVEYTLAMALSAATNFEEALGHLRHAHVSAQQELADQALLGKITVALGHLLYMRGSYDSALEQYARARQLFAKVLDPYNLAAIFTGLSRIHRQKGDLRSALRYSRLGLGVFESKHNQRDAAHELANMAARYDELGNTDQALATAHDSVARAQQSQAPTVEGLARSTLAAVYFRLGQFEEARAQAEAVEGLGLAEQDLGAIDTVVVLAKMAEHAGEHDRADEFYSRALDALQSNGFLARYADVALAYSELLRARGDVQRALDYALAAAKALSGRSA